MASEPSNAMRRVRHLVLHLAGLFAGLVLLAACQTTEVGDPALPNGFLETGIPDVELLVYAYVDPGHEITIPITLLAEGLQVTQEVRGTRVIVATHSDLESVGVRIDFSKLSTAEAMLQVAEQQTSGSGTVLPWLYRDGHSISVVVGDTTWAEEMQEAFVSNTTVSFQDTYPETWEVMRLLPEEPPAPAVGAGFVLNVNGLIEGFLERQDVFAPGLNGVLDLVRVGDVAFVAYATDLQALPTNLTELGLQKTNIGVIGVAKAGYPGPIINFLLNTFGSRVGLQRITIGDEEVRYRKLDDKAHLVLKTFGGLLYFAMSPTKEGAEQLMQSVIDNGA